jgi:hypothetical protein
MPEVEHPEGLFKVSPSVYAFENLVGLEVRWPGNRLGGRFPLDLRLAVEEHLLSVQLKPGWLRRTRSATEQVLRLRVRLRFCYIRYRSDAIKIVFDSMYERAIVEGKFGTSARDTSTGVTNSTAGAELGGKVDVTPATAAGSIGAGISARFRREQKRTTEHTTTMIPDIYEVRAVPGGWRIGDPEYGDPTGPSHCLDGPYLNQPVPEFPHTCEAEFLDGQERGTMTFEVTVRGGLYVERESGGMANRTDEERAVAKMRDSIAALRLERHLATSNASESRTNDEMVLATTTCEFLRAADSVTIDGLGVLSASISTITEPLVGVQQPNARRRKRP